MAISSSAAALYLHGRVTGVLIVLASWARMAPEPSGTTKEGKEEGLQGATFSADMPQGEYDASYTPLVMKTRANEDKPGGY